MLGLHFDLNPSESLALPFPPSRYCGIAVPEMHEAASSNTHNVVVFNLLFIILSDSILQSLQGKETPNVIMYCGIH